MTEPEQTQQSSLASLDAAIRASTHPRVLGPGFLDRCSPRVRRIYEYWDEKRGNRAMPARRDIDPLSIPRDLLPGIVLTEVLREPPWLRYRLVGTAQVALRGRDPTGQPVHGNYLGAHQGLPGDNVILNYRIVIEKKTVVYVYNPLPGPAPDGSSLTQRAVRGNGTVLMPLSNDGENVDTVFCFSDLDEP